MFPQSTPNKTPADVSEFFSSCLVTSEDISCAVTGFLHRVSTRPIAVVTSGGTIVPLEKVGPLVGPVGRTKMWTQAPPVLPKVGPVLHVRALC